MKKILVIGLLMSSTAHAALLERMCLDHPTKSRVFPNPSQFKYAYTAAKLNFWNETVGSISCWYVTADKPREDENQIYKNIMLDPIQACHYSERKTSILGDELICRSSPSKCKFRIV